MISQPLLSALAGGADIAWDTRTVRGVEIRARHVPAPGKVPVVCVHGMVVSSRYFVPTVRELAGDVDVWAPDLPGFAGSGPLPEGQDLSVATLADWLLAWLHEAGLAPAVLLANSFGCQIAVEAAVQRPDAVRSLVLNGPTTDPAARSARGLFGRWLRTGRRESMLQMPLLVQDYLDFGPRRAVSMLRSVLDDAIEDKLGDIDQPAVVVRGEYDDIVPQAWAEEVVRLLPRGRLVVVRGAAHTVNFTHPTELADAVRELVAVT